MKVAQSRPTLCGPLDYTVHGILQARILELGSLSLLQGLNSGIKPRSPALQADSLPAEPSGKPKYYLKVKINDVCVMEAQVRKMWERERE